MAGDDRGADLARPGLPVYQPATEVLAGTCRMPRAVRPSLISRARTPMTGMDRYTGRVTAVLAAGRGGGTTTTASRPPQSRAAATGWRIGPGQTPSLAGVAWSRRQLRVPSRPSGQGTRYPTLSTVRRVVIRTVSRDARR